MECFPDGSTLTLAQQENNMLKLLKIVTAVGPGLKKWIWSDGAFKLNRALTLLAGLAILSTMYHFLGEEGMTVVISFLDEFSDIIGYAD